MELNIKSTYKKEHLESSPLRLMVAKCDAGPLLKLPDSCGHKCISFVVPKCQSIQSNKAYYVTHKIMVKNKIALADCGNAP